MLDVPVNATRSTPSQAKPAAAPSTHGAPAALARRAPARRAPAAAARAARLRAIFSASAGRGAPATGGPVADDGGRVQMPGVAAP